MCHRGEPLTTSLPNRITEKVSTLKRFTENSVILENGEEIQIDSVVYCTGYKYDFSFLPKGMIKLREDNIVSNLYQSVMPVDYSTLFFMGLPREIPFFPAGDYQALFIRAVLDGTAKLPPVEEIKEMVSRGVSWAVDRTNWLVWIEDLATISGFESPRSTKALMKIWDYHFNLWLKDWASCWSLTYKIKGSDFVVVQ